MIRSCPSFRVFIVNMLANPIPEVEAKLALYKEEFRLLGCGVV
jgi:hypothetical protein